MVQTATPKAATGKRAPTPMARAFRIGVQSTDEIDFDTTTTMTASTQDLAVMNIPPAGFLQDLYILLTATVAGNSVATVGVTEDYPWNIIDTVTFEDVNNAPIVGPFSGWDLYCANKYGGYRFVDDPRLSPVYRVHTLTGTNASAASAAFVLRVPIELVQRDALGALPNKSGTAMFKLRVRLASTAVFTTPPTTPPSVRIQVQQADWWEPNETDLKGRPLAKNPPAVQTTQYWSKTDYTAAAGSIRQRQDRVGYLVRNFIYVLRDSSSNTKRSQGETNFPDPFMLRVEGNTLITRLKQIWLARLANQGYLGSAPAGSVSTTPVSIGDNYTGANLGVPSKDNGVYPLSFCDDFAFSKPGSETRRGYFETSSAARIEIQGTIGAGGTPPYTFTILTNDVAPVNGDDAALTV